MNRRESLCLLLMLFSFKIPPSAQAFTYIFDFIFGGAKCFSQLLQVTMNCRYF